MISLPFPPAPVISHNQQPACTSPVLPSRTEARCSIFWAYSLRRSLRSRQSTVLASPLWLASLAHCEVTSASHSMAFRLRDRRSSVLMRGISSFRRERSLLSCTWGRLLWWIQFFAKILLSRLSSLATSQVPQAAEIVCLPLIST